MSDGLVQNLRSYPHASRSLRDEAADRIEALEAALRKLSNMLHWEGAEDKARMVIADCKSISQRALEGKP